ncbi:MAG: 16S rRNA (cytosine(1402)-N(4))-methyltransferase RsmH [Phycisphaeraceae bacterium]
MNENDWDDLDFGWSEPASLLPGHAPVMVAEVLELLEPRPGQAVLDCTVGRGGHAAAIMPRLVPGGRYIGLDADAANVRELQEMADETPVPMTLAHANFVDARRVLDESGVDLVDGLLADLGFASTQMDRADRGLSFNAEGPLDMRLDQTAKTTAADLVNEASEQELADIIFRYGEERASRKIARKIVEKRQEHPIKTTRELADICSAAYGPAARRQRIDPATRTFQALRIAVNDELGALEQLLASLEKLVKPGGRVAIISFHSLEDRMVKQAFKALVAAGKAKGLTRKPLVAKDAERAANRRSRSAKLRAIELVDSDF